MDIWITEDPIYMRADLFKRLMKLFQSQKGLRIFHKVPKQQRAKIEQ